MSTLEKLLFQIFDGKNSTLNEIKQKAYEFRQNNVFKCIIDAQSSDPTEPKNEELIRELLCSRPPLSFPYSTNHNSLYNNKAKTVNREELSDNLCNEARASNKEVNDPTILPQCLINNAGLALNSHHEQESNASSPEERTEARILDSYHEADQSLVRFQRSKSRQKALELRNSARAGPKSCLHDVNNTAANSSEDAGYRIASLQSNHVNEFEPIKHLDNTDESSGFKEENVVHCKGKERGSSNYSGRITRSRSSSQKSNHVYQSSILNRASYVAIEGGDIFESIGKPVQQLNHVKESLELVNSSDTTNENCRVNKEVIGDKCTKENGSSDHCGRVTRSRQSGRITRSRRFCQSSNPNRSSYVSNEDGDRFESIRKPVQQKSHIKESLELVNPFDTTNESCRVNKEIIGDKCTKENGSDHCGRITRSRHHCLQLNSVNMFPKLDNSSHIPSIDGGTFQRSEVPAEEPSQGLIQFGGEADLPTVKGTQMSTARSLPGQMDLKLHAVNTRKHQSMGNDAEKYVGRWTRSQHSCTIQGMSEHVNSNISDHRVTRFRNAASNKFQNGQGDRISAGMSPPSQNDLEPCTMKTEEYPSTGNVADECTWSTIQGMSEHVNSNISDHRVTRFRNAASNKFQNGQGDQISAGMSPPRQNDLEPCTMNTEEYPSTGNVADECTWRNTRSQAGDSIEGGPLPINSNISDRIQSRNAASLVKSLDRFVVDDVHNASGIDVNVLPSTDTNDLVNCEMSGATLEGTEIVPDSAVEACAISSGSDRNGASLRVGLEILVSRPPSDSVMLVKPKLLDFDDMEEYSLKAPYSPSLEEKRGETSLEKGPSTLIEPVLLIEDLHKSSGIDVNVPPSTDTTDPSMGNVADECICRNTRSQAGNSIKGKPLPINSNIPDQRQPRMGASLVKSLDRFEVDDLHNASIIDVNVLLSTDADTTDLVNYERSGATLEETEIVPDSAAEACAVPSSSDRNGASVRGGLEVLGSRPPSDSLMLVRPKLLDFDDMEEYSLKAPYSPSLEEKRGETSLEKGPSTLLEPVRLMEEFSHPGRCISFAMEGSWPQYKRRKMEHQPTNVFSAPPSLTMKPFQSIARDDILRYLTEEDDSSQAFSTSLHEVEVAQSNNKNPDLKGRQIVNSHILEGSQDSSELRVEEGKLSFEGRDESTITSFIFKQEQLGPSLISSLTRQENGSYQSCLLEKVGVSSPTSTFLDVRMECTVEENQILSHPENSRGNAENLASVERSVLEKESHMAEDGLLSYCSVGLKHNQFLETADADQNMPVLEGFIVETNERQQHIVGGGISFQEEDLSNYTIERASFLEQLCKSAGMHTPLSQFSKTYKLHQTPHLYQSVPNRLLERRDLKNSEHFIDDYGKQFVATPSCLKDEVNWAFKVRSYSDGLPFSSAPLDWNVRNSHASPIGKLWEGTTSNSGSSEKHRSSNPELTCFTIDEDPNICEEMGNTYEAADTFQDCTGSIQNFTKREPLGDITKDYQNPPALVCEAEKSHDRGRLYSVNTETNFTRTHNKVKHKRSCTIEEKENLKFSLGANGVEKASDAFRNRSSKPKVSGKSSVRRGGTSISQRESKRNNIVSNMTSFVPLVQQKQAAAVITGKRDIKVKALEAAEAAKRLEEKREHERKMKKESHKIERARLEQENLKQLEMKKKQKEEEQKKKDADMALRKRLREGEERKDREVKRKRIEEAWRKQREHDDKLRAGKQAKVPQCRPTDESVRETKESKDDKGRHKKMEQEKREDNHGKKPETESRINPISMTDIHKTSIVVKEFEAFDDRDGIGMVIRNMDKTPENGNLVSKESREKSYEISPYQGSDDEEEEEDDRPNNKFIPSWASKTSVSLKIFSQQQIHPNVVFPPESFCSITEVLMPRDHQLK